MKSQKILEELRRLRLRKLATKKLVPHLKNQQKENDKKTEIPPSCLRLTTKDNILKFKLENLDQELLARAPLIRSALMSLKRSRRKGQDLFITPAVCTAASISLKNRSKSMTALQLIISVIMQHSGLMVSYSYIVSSFLQILHN